MNYTHATLVPKIARFEVKQIYRNKKLKFKAYTAQDQYFNFKNL